MAGEWILLVAGVKSHEMIVGGLSVLAAAAMLKAVYRSNWLHLQIHFADVMAAWRIPWYIVSGVYEITVVFLKDLFAHKSAGSYFRVADFKTNERSPLLLARGILATLYTTTAPNFIIIGIDHKQERMLFHQIERSGVPKMTKELGAET